MIFWKKKSLHYQLNNELPLNTPLKELGFTVFDTETTGFAVGSKDRMIEIGAVQVEGLEVTDHTFQTYVNPERDIPASIQTLTGIKPSDVEGAPLALEAIESFYQFIEQYDSGGWVGHYLDFDIMVLKKELGRHKLTFDEPTYIDTLDVIGYLNPSWDMRDLSHYAIQFGSKIFERHSALGDAQTTAHLLVELLHHIGDRGKLTLGDLIEITKKDNGY
ncbi:DNA polymerase-3 subunit epsilon [Sinobaca qinghaiensis]|uniref:DNA polymerase-3 subunit epsilon n=1 Tax=Sinobaca qinghaiensis TaxID=342944 RepID=A0A419UZQ7_9BACL|nr:3'-5' exonuclease [Sinobaca qinghaiensis]RKD71177.1 DNA polymerase-3 subunit epsilon [Sinobaca qinghaiensis]